MGKYGQETRKSFMFPAQVTVKSTSLLALLTMAAWSMVSVNKVECALSLLRKVIYDRIFFSFFKNLLKVILIPWNNFERRKARIFDTSNASIIEFNTCEQTHLLRFLCGKELAVQTTLFYLNKCLQFLFSFFNIEIVKPRFDSTLKAWSRCFIRVS